MTYNHYMKNTVECKVVSFVTCYYYKVETQNVRISITRNTKNCNGTSNNYSCKGGILVPKPKW